MAGTQPSWDGLQRYVGTAPIAMVLRFEAKVPGAPGVLREPGATPDLRRIFRRREGECVPYSPDLNVSSRGPESKYG